MDNFYLKRKWYTDNTTIGELHFNEMPHLLCYVLEPTVRVGKDPRGIIAIPPGKYEITTYLSPSRKILVPLLNNVPGRTYIEIHVGNYKKDTLGCLLPGMIKGVDSISDSKKAFTILMEKINESIAKGPVYISISNGAA